MDHCIELPAVLASLPELASFGDAVELDLPLTFDQSYLMRLAIEELATNVIKYGYERDSPGPIQICCAYAEGQLRIVVRDRGRPFDPGGLPDPDLGGEVQQRRVGGLGIYLVRQLSDEMVYRYDAASGWNELVILKGAEDAHV